MSQKIIALSGHVASGKTALATSLRARYAMQLVKTRSLIQQETGAALERLALQKAGARLDQKTGGRWLGRAISRLLLAGDLERSGDVIVDSCRRQDQIDGIREAFGASRVIHLHLVAPDEELKRRYQSRGSRIAELPTYDDVRADPTEAQVRSLADSADIVIDTVRCTQSDVVVRAAARLGLYGRSYERLVDVLVGGQWGSEGKGHLASYLSSEYDVLVRVGGPNAGHKVFRRGETAITYYHLPSGTREGDAKIVLGPGAVLNVDKVLKEAADAELTPERLFIDPQAMTIEAEDVAFENAELTDIGSTKQGVGKATSRKVLRTAAQPLVRLAREIDDLQPFLRETRDVLDESFRRGHRVFLEGTQGTGLSLHHGTYPYVTSRDTTVSGCLAEAGIAPSRVNRTIMLVRSYPIRVGGSEHSGDMGREVSKAEIARRSGINYRKLLATERTSTTDRPRRIAEFNWTLLREAASLNGPTDVALSFADYIDAKNKTARRFEQLTPDTIRFVEEVERVVTAPVSLIVTDFRESALSVIDRRKWGGR